MGRGHAHFGDKEAMDHVVERMSEGKIASAEGHGVEMPGHIAAGTDAMRGTALLLLLFWGLLGRLSVDGSLLILAVFGIGWMVWSGGRSALLGWQHLERLHNVMEEERWEIEHHRDQEREELKELYAAKGFNGDLLDEVVEVLMADGDRLLKVMLEEELGLSLETQEHPLIQGLGAVLGALVSMAVFLSAAVFLPDSGVMVVALALMGAAGVANSRYEKNELIPAVLWNVGLGALAFGTVTFLFDYLVFKA